MYSNNQMLSYVRMSTTKLFTLGNTVIMIVIVTTGASCVGELLKVNNSLQELDMSFNPIDDDGVSAVADGLQCNNTLTKLNIGECGFSVKGTVVYKTEFKIIWSFQSLSSFSVFGQTRSL